MDPQAIDRVASALRSTNTELTRGDEEAERVVLTALVSRFLKLTGGSMSPAARAEYLDEAVAELAEMPYLLVEPMLHEARRRVEFPSKLVAWVAGQIEQQVLRLQRERAVYVRLLEIADGNG